MPEPSKAGQLADRLIEFVVGELAELESRHAPGLRLPGVFAGHRVDESTTADLIYTLGLLAAEGVERVGEVDCASRARELIAGLDPSAVEGFAAYRVSESAARLVRRDSDAWNAPDLAHAVEAGESPGVVDKARNGELPTNWIAVAARCLAGTRALGGEAPSAAELNAMLAKVFSEAVDMGTAWLDDSGSWGEQYAAYDIYTPDTYLFAQPLAEDLGKPWGSGLRSVFADLEEVAQPGGAVVWGRSVGALALAITVELAGIATSHGLSEHTDRWLARAEEAFAELADWFDGGLIAAHQGRQTMFYRGPARRLQMTLDIHSKLLLAAAELRMAPETAYFNDGSTWLAAERLIEFDRDRRAALWSWRSRELTFALPMLASWSTDYSPSPRAPGLFEMPTSGHPCMLPVLTVGAEQLIPAGLPTSIEHSPGQLLLGHSGWAPAGAGKDSDQWLAGSRHATYRVEGRTLRVEETLELDELPTGAPLSITIPALAERPLDVAVDDGDAHLQQIDTSGIAEWRSFWSELPVVHQIEIRPAPAVRLSWSVTPRLRVASTIMGHQYDRSLYGPLADRLLEVPAPGPGEDLTRLLRGADILHVAWPEWWSGVEPDQTATTLNQVRASGVKVVWTQHNLMPHYFKTPEAAACYQQWAEAADAVIHHTESGKAVALETYRYGPETRHVVIPHGHWGAQYPRAAKTDRTAIERELQWPHDVTRLAVVGAPRKEKDIQLVLDAFAATGRPDLHLVVRIDGEESLPDDSRITVDNGGLPDHLYHRRMHAIDALIMPFAGSGMMTTGTAFDAIGSGTAAITSEWAFFDETFAGADIRYGSTREDLGTCLAGLTPADLERSAAAMTELQPRFEWELIAEKTMRLFEDLYEE